MTGALIVYVVYAYNSAWSSSGTKPSEPGIDNGDIASSLHDPQPDGETRDYEKGI
jgi:hypothetical protein